MRLRKLMIVMASAGILLALGLQIAYIVSDKKRWKPILRFNTLDEAITKLEKFETEEVVRFKLAGDQCVLIYEPKGRIIHTEKVSLRIESKR